MLTNLESLSTFSIVLALAFVVVGILLLFGRYYLRFLTLRYLRNRFLSYVSILVIGLAVAFLVVAPSVMNGFGDEFRKKVRGTLSDLMVWGPTPFSFPAPGSYDHLKEDEARIELQQSLLDEIYGEMREVTGVEQISPYIENPALYKHAKSIDYCFVRGIEPTLETQVSQFESYILSPRQIFELSNEDEIRQAGPEEKAAYEELAETLPDTVDHDKLFQALATGVRVPEPPPEKGVEGPVQEPKRLPAVLVGIYFLKFYNLSLYDVIELTTASDSQETTDTRFVIVGAFKSGFYDPDRRKIYMSLRAAQDFIRIERRISGISIKCKEGERAEVVRKRIGRFVYHLIEQGKFPTRSPARTWEEKDANLLQAVAMEKLLIRLITGMGVIVSLASIFVVLLMSVREKARDLGVLKALGGSTAGILRIYIGQGVVMSLFGVLLGLLVGIGVASYINELATVIHAATGWHPFPPDIYYLDRIPVLIDLGEVFQIVGGTTIVAILLAGVPGLWAAKLDPIEAVRYE